MIGSTRKGLGSHAPSLQMSVRSFTEVKRSSLSWGDRQSSGRSGGEVLQLVPAGKQIDSALLVRESTSSRACACRFFPHQQSLRSSIPGSSRSNRTLHYIHAGAPYTFTGNEEISIIRGRNPWNFNLQILNPFSPGKQRKIYQMGMKENGGPKGMKKKGSRSVGHQRLLVSTPAQDGIPRNSESIYSIGGHRKQLENQKGPTVETYSQHLIFCNIN